MRIRVQFLPVPIVDRILEQGQFCPPVAFDPLAKITSGGLESDLPSGLSDFENQDVGIERHYHAVAVAVKLGTQGGLRKIFVDRDPIGQQLEIAYSMRDQYSQLSLEICNKVRGSYRFVMVR